MEIRAPALVGEDSAAAIVLRRLAGADLDTVAAARALVRRHLPVRAAHAAMTRLFDTGEVDVEVPKVECMVRLKAELNALGIDVRLRSEALQRLVWPGGGPGAADVIYP